MIARFPPDPGRKPPELLPAGVHVANWLAYEGKHKRPNTLKRFRGVGRALVAGAGDYDLTRLSSAQYQGFVAEYAKRCRYFVTHTKFTGRTGCKQKQSLATCPVLLGGDLKACPKYKPLTATTVGVFISGLEVCNDYLLVNGLIPTNPVSPIRMHHLDTNRRALTRERHKTDKIAFTLEHIKKLLEGSAIEHQFAYFMSAKYGLRPSEVLNLVDGPAHFRPQEKAVILTDEDGRPGLKRLGNCALPWDAETESMFAVWMPYRAHILDTPSCRDLAVTKRGQGWSLKNYGQMLNKALKKDCERLKLYPKEGGHYTWKAFRKFFNKTLEDNECPPRWVDTLRGDLVEGNSKFYWNSDSELHRMYDKYGPKLLK